MSYLLSAQDAGRGAGGAPPVVTLTIPSFPDGGQFPVKFSQAAPGVPVGEGTSPAMTWANAPAGTQSFFLNMHDMDLARNKTTDDQAHWVFWNIPATITGLPEGVPRIAAARRKLSGQRHGPHVPRSGAGANGPFHHYIFELYALDIKLDGKPTAADARNACQRDESDSGAHPGQSGLRQFCSGGHQ